MSYHSSSSSYARVDPRYSVEFKRIQSQFDQLRNLDREFLLEVENLLSGKKVGHSNNLRFDISESKENVNPSRAHHSSLNRVPSTPHPLSRSYFKPSSSASTQDPTPPNLLSYVPTPPPRAQSLKSRKRRVSSTSRPKIKRTPSIHFSIGNDEVVKENDMYLGGYHHDSVKMFTTSPRNEKRMREWESTFSSSSCGSSYTGSTYSNSTGSSPTSTHASSLHTPPSSFGSGSFRSRYITPQRSFNPSSNYANYGYGFGVSPVNNSNPNPALLKTRGINERVVKSISDFRDFSLEHADRTASLTREKGKGKSLNNRLVTVWFRSIPVIAPSSQPARCLVKVLLIDQDGDELFRNDVNVRSGFTPVKMEDDVFARDWEGEESETSFRNVKSRIIPLIKNKTLIGHDVYTFLRALDIPHPPYLIRDISTFKPIINSLGLPEDSVHLQVGHKPTLRLLARKLLGRRLSLAEGRETELQHARASLELYKMWGETWENGVRAGKQWRV